MTSILMLATALIAGGAHGGGEKRFAPQRAIRVAHYRAAAGIIGD